jgi:alpha-beta hydrolase superfamily lysophospholipase
VRRKNAASRLTATAARPLIIGGAATIIALELARRLFRHTQLFNPDRAPLKSWNPDDYGIPSERVTQEWFETPDGEILYGWYCRAEKPIATGVFCHGNTGNLTTSADVIPHLLNTGFNVLMFDYRGFGKSTGRPSFAGVVADAITAAKFHDQIRPKNLPTLLYGYSLGGAIAAQVGLHHPFDGLILQSTFTNLQDLARVTWPRLPLHLFAGKVLDTHTAIRSLRVPLLVLHGGDDEVVPCWMAHALYEACPAEKAMHVVDGGLHKDLFHRDAYSLVRAIHRFVTDLPRHARAHLVEKPNAFEQTIDTALRAIRRYFRARQAGVRHAV